MNKVRRYATIRIKNLSKIEVEEKIKDLLDNKEIDFEIKEEENIIVVLGANGEKEDEAKAKIKPIVKEIKNRFLTNIVSRHLETLEYKLVHLLEEKDLTISTAESCSGGLLAARLINVSGVSEVYKEGFITYTNKSKRKTLNVSKHTLKKYGAVSRQTAKEMATGALLMSGSNVSLSITGIAGPDGGTEEKPVGLVYVACYYNDNVVVRDYLFKGNRLEIRNQSVDAALSLLEEMLESN